jgi:hypothetical protein
MSNCAFTICATNYIGLAEILGNTIQHYYKDLDFYIIVSDEPNEKTKKTFSQNILIGREILYFPKSKWYEMAYKYDLTEFCTSIKPASILYFFDKGYNKCIYFDPDIMVFSSIGPIYKYLDQYLAIVTPHILQLEEIYTGTLKERFLLHSGVFNLGFIALRNTHKIIGFLKWWTKRLESCCYNSKYEPFFTDQKWVDLLPCYLGKDLLISLNLGMNVAPWNFHEREIIKKENKLYVKNRIIENIDIDELVFVHFSGFRYSDLLAGKINRIDDYDYSQFKDIQMLFNRYAAELKKGDFDEYINNPYSYNYYKESGYKINAVVRRLYRSYQEIYDYKENPFDENSYFFKIIVKKKLIGKENYFKSTKYVSVENNLSDKLKLLNKVFTLLFKIVGTNKYFDILKALRVYSVWENHYHLIKKKKDEYKLFDPKM